MRLLFIVIAIVVVIIVIAVLQLVVWLIGELLRPSKRPEPTQTPKDIAAAAEIPERGSEIEGNLVWIYAGRQKQWPAVLDMLVSVFNDQRECLMADVKCRLTPISKDSSWAVWMGSLTRDGILRSVAQGQALTIRGDTNSPYVNWSAQVYASVLTANPDTVRFKIATPTSKRQFAD